MSMIREIEIPDSEELIDIVPDRFILDDGKTVDNPVGNYCSKFTLMAQLILAEKSYVKKISSICRKAGIDIDGIVPITLAERNLVLVILKLEFLRAILLFILVHCRLVVIILLVILLMF